MLTTDGVASSDTVGNRYPTGSHLMIPNHLMTNQHKKEIINH